MSRSIRNIWFPWQVISLLAGFGILVLLVVLPELGLKIFWSGLIAIAPLVLLLFPGIWRNICPLGIVSMIPSRMGFSLNRKIRSKLNGRLKLMAVILLLATIPLRHLWLDTRPDILLTLLLVMGAVAFVMGVFYDYKSGWCNTLCPVQPVEQLYGRGGLFTTTNSHCIKCSSCSRFCPDKVADPHPLRDQRTTNHFVSGTLLVGGFPGFIIGWFLVPTVQGAPELTEVVDIYAYPVIGMLITLILFSIVRFIMKTRELLVINMFAAFALSSYYWFRIPALLGFGVFPGEGVLIDLSGKIQSMIPVVISVLIIAVIWSRLVIGRNREHQWEIPPPTQHRRVRR